MWLRSRVFLGALAAASVSAAAPAVAHADNIVPNPSFEVGCPTFPASWSPQWPGTLGCSTFARTGFFGAGVEGYFGAGAFTACVTRPLSGDYAASFAYRASPDGLDVGMVVDFFADAGCSDTLTLARRLLRDTTITSGSFELVSGTVNAPAGTDSVQFSLFIWCGLTSCSAAFDDVSLEGPATAVTFRSLSATATSKGVSVRWRTASQSRTLGFRVYREVNGRRVRVTPRLIPAIGRRSYSFLDRNAAQQRSARYWIQVVGVDGSTNWYGPARVSRS